VWFSFFTFGNPAGFSVDVLKEEAPYPPLCGHPALRDGFAPSGFPEFAFFGFEFCIMFIAEFRIFVKFISLFKNISQSCGFQTAKNALGYGL
jgi:hypothetical protein